MLFLAIKKVAKFMYNEPKHYPFFVFHLSLHYGPFKFVTTCVSLSHICNYLLPNVNYTLLHGKKTIKS